MDRDYMLEEVKKHIKKYYDMDRKRPKNLTAKNTFEIRAYQLWAAKEFYNYIYRNGPCVIESGHQFVEMVDDFSCKDVASSWIFSIAYDVAVEMLDFIYTLSP